MRKSETAIFSGIVVLAVGLSAAAWMMTVDRRQEGMMRRDAVKFAAAVSAYQAAYNKMPSRYNGYVDVSYGDDVRFPNQHVTNVLLAENASGNRGDLLNPQKTIFMTNQIAGVGRSGLRSDREWLDPWGEPYCMVLDTDGDNVCTLDASIHHGTPAVGMQAVMWSGGPDQSLNTRDDILTWRLLYDLD